jgi:hypothetical protein
MAFKERSELEYISLTCADCGGTFAVVKSVHAKFPYRYCHLCELIHRD